MHRFPAVRALIALAALLLLAGEAAHVGRAYGNTLGPKTTMGRLIGPYVGAETADVSLGRGTFLFVRAADGTMRLSAREVPIVSLRGHAREAEFCALVEFSRGRWQEGFWVPTRRRERQVFRAYDPVTLAALPAAEERLARTALGDWLREAGFLLDPERGNFDRSEVMWWGVARTSLALLYTALVVQGILLVPSLLAGWWSRNRAARWVRRGYCAECHYSLHGLNAGPDQRCPECGCNAPSNRAA